MLWSFKYPIWWLNSIYVCFVYLIIFPLSGKNKHICSFYSMMYLLHLTFIISTKLVGFFAQQWELFFIMIPYQDKKIYSGYINAETIKLVFVPCLHVNHVRLRSMNKDWLAQNQDNVSGWSDISTPELLF